MQKKTKEGSLHW